MINSTVEPLAVSYATAAKMLDISLGTLRFMIRSGALPIVVVNRREKIAVADLRHYVEQRRVLRPFPGGEAS